MAAEHGSMSHPPGQAPSSRRGLWRNHPALMVALTYAVIGLVYIALSDQVVSFLFQHNEERVTAIQTWKGWAWIVLTTFLIFFLVKHSINEVWAAQREVSAVDARYRTMIETTNEGVVLADAEKRCQYVNRTMAEMLGATPEELIGKRCGECAHESHQPVIDQAMAATMRDEPQRFDCLFRRKDGSSLWTIVSASPIVDQHSGLRTATLFMVTDITARKAAEQALERTLDTQRRLLNELDHRVRNNLSSLSSLIDLSRSSTGSVDEFAAMISGRVQAMAKAHALVARSGIDGQDFGRVIAEMIPPGARARVSIDGAPFSVASGHIVSLTMLFHELASRSLRTGVLAQDDGRVQITWRSERKRDEPASVFVRWSETPYRESAVPRDEHADSLIAGLVERDLHGRIASRREGDAQVHELDMALNDEPHRVPA